MKDKSLLTILMKNSFYIKRKTFKVKQHLVTSDKKHVKVEFMDYWCYLRLQLPVKRFVLSDCKSSLRLKKNYKPAWI